MTATRSLRPDLGLGVYAIPEAARYLEVAPARLRHWFKPQGSRHGASQSDFRVVDGQLAISFLDLVDAQVAVQLRALGLSMQRIRKVYAALQAEFGSPHPFCSNQLYTGGNTVFLRGTESASDAGFMEVLTKQHYFERILMPFLRCVEYDPGLGLARRWRISPGVVMDPGVALGKPVLEGTRLSTYVIAQEYFANHADAALVAALYGVDEASVLSAVQFEQRYNRPLAA